MKRRRMAAGGGSVSAANDCCYVDIVKAAIIVAEESITACDGMASSKQHSISFLSRSAGVGGNHKAYRQRHRNGIALYSSYAHQ